MVNVAPHEGQNFAFRRIPAWHDGHVLPTGTAATSAETSTAAERSATKAATEAPSKPAANV